MSNTSYSFTPEQQAQLQSLPAVQSVSASRITYTESFKYECMRRYELGESPRKIFVRAGFDPKVIGGKRIERCIARWKKAWRENRIKRPESRAYTQADEVASAQQYEQMIERLTDMRRMLDDCLHELYRLDARMAQDDDQAAHGDGRAL